MLQRLRIATRINLITGVVLLAVIGLLGYGANALLTRNAVAASSLAATRTARLLRSSLERHMMSRDLASIQGDMELLLRGSPFLDRLRLINSQGEVVASTDPGDAGLVIPLSSPLCRGCHDAAGAPPAGVRPAPETILPLQDELPSFSVVAAIDNQERCASAPCHAHLSEERVLGLVEVSFPLGELRQQIAGRRLATLAGAAAAILLTSLLSGLYVHRGVSRPLSRLVEGMERLGRGELDVRLDEGRRDEIGLLAGAFDRMSGQLAQRTRELAGTRDHLASILENSADMIISSTPEGTIETVNQATLAILGYDRGELVGQPSSILFADPADREWVVDLLRECDTLLGHSTRFRRRDGKVLDVFFSVSRLRDRAGRTVGTVAIGRDVTEVKRLQDQLLQAERLAAIGQALAGVLHGIKNILNSLKGGAYMVNLALAREDRVLLREGWEVVESGIGRVSELSLDLLDFTRSRQGEPAVGSANLVLEDVCRLAAAEAAPAGVELACRTDPQLPPALLEARGLHAALLNLATNAIDACRWKEYPPGESPRVELSSAVDGQTGDLLLTVRDNGCGIEESLREKIFTQFFTTKADKGTGLGLPLAHKAVREQGGTIELHSRPGAGSTFTVRLPLRRAPA